MNNVFAAITDDAVRTITTATFGHLFPDHQYYEGSVCIAAGNYGSNGTVISECSNLPRSSPWWFSAISNFADKECKELESGTVCEFKISVNIIDCIEELEQWQIDENLEEPDSWEPEEWKEIQIKRLTKKVLFNPYK